jgi:hypothetical protein
MARADTLGKIEKEIEKLPPKDQLMLVEKLAHQLRKTGFPQEDVMERDKQYQQNNQLDIIDIEADSATARAISSILQRIIEKESSSDIEEGELSETVLISPESSSTLNDPVPSQYEEKSQDEEVVLSETVILGPTKDGISTSFKEHQMAERKGTDEKDSIITRILQSKEENTATGGEELSETVILEPKETQSKKTRNVSYDQTIAGKYSKRNINNI